jgi:hypothetical protein
MTLELTNGTGAQTLDIKQPEWRDEGWGVAGDVSTPGSGPLAVTVNTGTLGGGNGALSVASGDAFVDGTVVSYGGGTVDIQPGNSEPRKDLIWIDDSGTIQVEQGTPAAAAPAGESDFATFLPAVPFPSTTPATVLAAVAVPANASSIGSAQLQDRRLTSQGVLSSLSTDSLVIGGTLYELDGTIDVAAQSSVTYNVSETFDQIVIIPDHQDPSFNQIQVNGDTGANYDVIDNADATTTGQNQWDIPKLEFVPYLKIWDRRDASLHLHAPLGQAVAGQTVAGENQNATGPISSITFKDDGAVNRDLTANVYGRSV